MCWDILYTKLTDKSAKNKLMAGVVAFRLVIFKVKPYRLSTEEARCFQSPLTNNFSPS